MKIEFILKERTIIDIPEDKRIIISESPNLKFSEQLIGTQEVDYKPTGLWYAIGDAWVNYLKHNAPQRAFKYMYEIKINTSSMCMIDTEAKVYHFTQKYTKARYGIKMINWNRVSQDFTGIEFNPYFWKLRREFQWYNPVDVPSGCIWNKSAINDIQLISDNWKENDREEQEESEESYGDEQESDDGSFYLKPGEDYIDDPSLTPEQNQLMKKMLTRKSGY